MKQYLDLVNKILTTGKEKMDRTGTGTLAVFGEKIEHNMKEGFPLLTTKKMARKTMLVELEGFLKGITDKSWYQERGCHIWDEWCNPQKVPYGHNITVKRRMVEERDLGPIYGAQWINWNNEGINQLESVVNTLKENPNSRRMLVTSWNPSKLNQMALEPCHVLYQADVIDNELHLAWYQRSIDTMLGLPFNIASYATILHLLSKESGIPEGKVIGFLGDTHIYKNHIKKAKEQLKNKPLSLPKIETKKFTSIFDWTHEDTQFNDYQSHQKIEFPIAV
jgi:thymidylate synthase